MDTRTIHSGKDAATPAGLPPTTVRVDLAEISRLAREHGSETQRRQQLEAALRRLESEHPDANDQLLVLENDLLGINQRINARGEVLNAPPVVGATTQRDITRLESRINELESALTQVHTRAIVAHRPSSDDTPMANVAVAPQRPLTDIHVQVPTKEIQRLDPASVMATSLVPAVTPERQAVVPAKPHKPWAYTRGVRIVVGLIILAIVLGAVGLPMLFPISSLAVVNARTVQISSSIAGEVSGMPNSKGIAVAIDQPLGSILNRTIDASELNNRRNELSKMTASLEAIDGEIVKRTAEVEKFREEFALHRACVANDAKAIVAIESAELTAAKEDYAARRRDLERLVGLGEGMVATKLIDEIRDKALLASSQVDTRVQRLDRAKARLTAAEQGVFIDQSQPLVLGKLQEAETGLGNLRVRKDSLTTEILAARTTVRSLEEELEAKRRAMIRAPINGSIWTTEVSPGQWVDAAQPLMRVADLGTMVVEAWMPQRHIDDVAIGDSAIVRFYGEQQPVLGRVIEKDIPNLSELDPNLAVQQRPNESKVFRVRILLPPEKLQFQFLGQRVKVLVTGNDPNWFRRGLLRFCAWMEL